MLTLITKILRKPQSKEAGYYFLANMFKALVSVVITPVHTHLLAPTQYGLWSIWSSVLSFFDQLVDMGQKSVIQKHFHTDSDFPQTLANTLSLVLLSALACGGGLAIVAYAQKEMFGIPTVYYLFIPLFALGTVLFLINSVLLRHENKPVAFCLYQVAHALGTAGLGVVFVWYWQASWLGLMLGMGGSLALLAGLSLWRFAVQYNAYPRFNRAKITALFLIGAPMIFYGINTMVIALSDRLILAELFDSATVGIYTANYKIGMASHVLMYAVINTMVPWQYQQLKNLNEGTTLKLAQYALVFKLGMVLMAAAVMLVAPWLVDLFFAEAYHGMNDVIYWIVLAALVQAWYSIYFHMVIFYGQMRIFITISVIASCLNIGLTIYLAQAFGAVGAAIATFIAYSVIFVGLYYKSRAHVKLPLGKAARSLLQRGSYD